MTTTSTTPATTATSLELTKLQTHDLPKLKGHAPPPLSIALWLRAMARWSQLSGFRGYLEPPYEPNPNVTLTRDALRYISAAIESLPLKGAFADQNFLTPKDAINWIKQKWLHGESESTILKRKLTTQVFSEEQGLQPFLADFNLYLSHILPVIPSKEAADILDSALPERFDPFIQASRMNPGTESIPKPDKTVDEKKSFAAYTENIAMLAAKSEARRTARAARHHSTPSAFDSLNNHTQLNTSHNSTSHEYTDECGLSDYELRLQRAAQEFEALTTQARAYVSNYRPGSNEQKNPNYPATNRTGVNPSQPTRTNRPTSSTMGTKNSLTDTVCHACGLKGHMAVDCPQLPKPVCTHGLCLHRGRFTHLPQFCPFLNPACLTNERLRMRCQHEAEIWRIAQEQALKSNPTPALHTQEYTDEAQAFFLDDLNDDTDPEYDALTTCVVDADGANEMPTWADSQFSALVHLLLCINERTWLDEMSLEWMGWALGAEHSNLFHQYLAARFALHSLSSISADFIVPLSEEHISAIGSLTEYIHAQVPLCDTWFQRLATTLPPHYHPALYTYYKTENSNVAQDEMTAAGLIDALQTHVRATEARMTESDGTLNEIKHTSTTKRFYHDPIALARLHNHLGIPRSTSNRICQSIPYLTHKHSTAGEDPRPIPDRSSAFQPLCTQPSYPPPVPPAPPLLSSEPGTTEVSPLKLPPPMPPHAGATPVSDDWQACIQAELDRLSELGFSPVTDTVHTTPEASPCTEDAEFLFTRAADNGGFDSYGGMGDGSTPTPAHLTRGNAATFSPPSSLGSIDSNPPSLASTHKPIDWSSTIQHHTRAFPSPGTGFSHTPEFVPPIDTPSAPKAMRERARMAHEQHHGSDRCLEDEFEAYVRYPAQARYPVLIDLSSSDASDCTVDALTIEADLMYDDGVEDEPTPKDTCQPADKNSYGTPCCVFKLQNHLHPNERDTLVLCGERPRDNLIDCEFTNCFLEPNEPLITTHPDVVQETDSPTPDILSLSYNERRNTMIMEAEYLICCSINDKIDSSLQDATLTKTWMDHHRSAPARCLTAAPRQPALLAPPPCTPPCDRNTGHALPTADQDCGTSVSSQSCPVLTKLDPDAEVPLISKNSPVTTLTCDPFEMKHDFLSYMTLNATPAQPLVYPTFSPPESKTPPCKRSPCFILPSVEEDHLSSEHEDSQSTARRTDNLGSMAQCTIHKFDLLYGTDLSYDRTVLVKPLNQLAVLVKCLDSYPVEPPAASLLQFLSVLHFPNSVVWEFKKKKKTDHKYKKYKTSISLAQTQGQISCNFLTDEIQDNMEHSPFPRTTKIPKLNNNYLSGQDNILKNLPSPFSPYAGIPCLVTHVKELPTGPNDCHRSQCEMRCNCSTKRIPPVPTKICIPIKNHEPSPNYNALKRVKIVSVENPNTPLNTSRKDLKPAAQKDLSQDEMDASDALPSEPLATIPAMVNTIQEDRDLEHPDYHKTQHSGIKHDKYSPSPVNIDLDGPMDFENRSGFQGFHKASLIKHNEKVITLNNGLSVRGTSGTHTQYFISVMGTVITDVRHDVFTCRKKKTICLFSSTTAAKRGILTVSQSPLRGLSFLMFPRGEKVILKTSPLSPHTHLAARYLSYWQAEEVAQTVRSRLIPTFISNLSPTVRNQSQYNSPTSVEQNRHKTTSFNNRTRRCKTPFNNTQPRTTSRNVNHEIDPSHATFLDGFHDPYVKETIFASAPMPHPPDCDFKRTTNGNHDHAVRENEEPELIKAIARDFIRSNEQYDLGKPDTRRHTSVMANLCHKLEDEIKQACSHNAKMILNQLPISIHDTKIFIAQRPDMAPSQEPRGNKTKTSQQNNSTREANVIVVKDDTTPTLPDTHDALTTKLDSSTEPQMTIVDSGCFVDVEDERGAKGFFGPQKNCRVTLVTGTDEHTRPQFLSSHVQFLIDTEHNIIEDTRDMVYSCANTTFQRCLFSPNSAAARGIITVLIPPNKGSSYIQFPTGQKVALINNGKAYLLPRYFSRENAEKARSNRPELQQHLTPIPALNVEAVSHSLETANAILWHRRLGHRGLNILTQLSEHCLDAPTIKQLRPHTRASLQACAICPAARLKRKAQTKNDPTTHSHTAKINAFGHCIARDHFGPLTKSFSHEYVYGQILVDIHSSGIWFYAQRNKTAEETLTVTKRFEADTNTYGNIKCYHSDGAKEFTGTLMTDYCLNKNPPTRITFTTTAASNSNPCAENAVSRLLNIAKALLIDSGFSQHHWPVACAHASEIIKLTPRLYPKNKNEICTPHFMCTGQKPSLKHLHLFGCVVHALHNPNQL